MLIFGRQLSAAEALQNGLVSRVLWPVGVADQIKTIAKEIAMQPPQVSILIIFIIIFIINFLTIRFPSFPAV